MINYAYSSNQTPISVMNPTNNDCILSTILDIKHSFLLFLAIHLQHYFSNTFKEMLMIAQTLVIFRHYQQGLGDGQSSPHLLLLPIGRRKRAYKITMQQFVER